MSRDVNMSRDVIMITKGTLRDKMALIWSGGGPVGPPSDHSPDGVRVVVPLDAAPTISLERKSSLSRTMGVIVLYCLLEISKQVLNFKMARLHHGKFLVPPTVILLMGELCKLVMVVTLILVRCRSLLSVRPSLRFGFPAFCYSITSLLYLTALTTVSPPLWMVLIQTRTLYTAALYRMVFGRRVSREQVLGCVLIVLSIPVAKMSDLWQEHSVIFTTAVLVQSQVCAILSTVAAVSVELLLKNDRRDFLEQQLWLYLWGLCFAALSVPATVNVGLLPQLVKGLSQWEAVLLGGAVVASALGGLCVPVIVKRLDTIVKDYLGAINNILLAVVTAVIFPALFKFSWMFMSSLLVLGIGIGLYERFSESHTDPDHVHKQIEPEKDGTLTKQSV